jgi:hypothetical protein
MSFHRQPNKSSAVTTSNTNKCKRNNYNKLIDEQEKHAKQEKLHYETAMRYIHDVRC